jgi:single-stranded DNA-specific DHH superfamily exonuclease
VSRHIDVFNGDADGICALHQLRLADPQSSELVTGVKRDIVLLDRVSAGAGDRVTVCDISLHSNRVPLQWLLAAGAEVLYFDHHYAGDVPLQGRLDAHIDTSADVCTSLLVDRHLGGRYRPWAIAAAFGDSLRAVGERLAAEHGLDAAQTAVLAQLGECINYNAYGESVADLWFDPIELYRALSGFRDPLEFARESPIFAKLQAGYREDMAKASGTQPHALRESAAVYVLPDAAWARRVIGVFANRLAQDHPARAHALLSQNADGCYTVSVRASRNLPDGADALCRQFNNGGGRKAAAGINGLPGDEFGRFVGAFFDAFAGSD